MENFYKEYCQENKDRLSKLGIEANNYLDDIDFIDSVDHMGILSDFNCFMAKKKNEFIEEKQRINIYSVVNELKKRRDYEQLL